ncbi:Uncharacterised protein [Raoultella ornithinolytica]|nr:Uncharacterised protein [Raoultella ornithinolytica]
MDGGTQVAIGGQLQQFANIDDKTTGQRSRIDPLTGGNFYLQTLLLILKQEAENPESLCAPTPWWLCVSC